MGEVTFNRIVDHLWKNRRSYDDRIFDYPDYGGLPNRIADRLSSDEVDAIQASWSYLIPGNKWSVNRKRMFAGILRYEMSCAGATIRICRREKVKVNKCV